MRHAAQRFNFAPWPFSATRVDHLQAHRLASSVHVGLERQYARGLHQRHVGIGPDVIRVRRQIELCVVTHHFGGGDIFRHVSLRIELERDGDVGYGVLAVRVDMQVESHFRTSLYQAA